MDTAATAYLCSVVSGPQLGRLKGWGDSTAGVWKGNLITHPVIDAGYWLGSQLGLLAKHLYVAPLCGCLNSLTAWCLGFKSKQPKGNKPVDA